MPISPSLRLAVLSWSLNGEQQPGGRGPLAGHTTAPVGHVSISFAAYSAMCINTSSQNRAFPKTDSKHVPVKQNMFLNEALASYCCWITNLERCTSGMSYGILSALLEYESSQINPSQMKRDVALPGSASPLRPFLTFASYVGVEVLLRPGPPVAAQPST